MANPQEQIDIKGVGCSRCFDGIKICGMNNWLCPSCAGTQFSQEITKSYASYTSEIYKKVDAVFLKAREKKQYTKEYVLCEVISIVRHGMTLDVVKKLNRLIQWIDDCE